MHFAYVENGGYEIVLSEKIGEGGEPMTSMDTVTFDHPSEYITRVSGEYRLSNRLSGGGKYLSSITFFSNKGTYGPYGPESPDNSPASASGQVTKFNNQAGGKFCGFFGTYKYDGIESIGFYMKPIEKTASQMQHLHDHCNRLLRASGRPMIPKRKFSPQR